MDSQPLDAREAWAPVLELEDYRADPKAPAIIEAALKSPASLEHPAWRSCRDKPRQFRPVEPGRRHVVAWVGGSGSAVEPWVVELSTAGRWPNLAELRGALRALTGEGAVFEFGFPFLSAAAFTDIPPILMVQVAALPGSPAESRLKLTGGVPLTPPTPPTNGGLKR